MCWTRRFSEGCLNTLLLLLATGPPGCNSFPNHAIHHCQVVPSGAQFPRLQSALKVVNGDRSSKDEKTNYNYIGLTTNKNAPYVPSGLSAEEYQKIKQVEAAKLAKMKFGAWGPRFRQTQAPDGDWMVQSSLWVKGFQSSGRATLSDEKELERNESRRRRLVSARIAVTSFLLAYFLLDMLLFSVLSPSWSSIRSPWGILRAMRQHVGSSLAMNKLQCLKCTVATLVVPIVSRYQEICYRQLWSKRKTFGLPILASLLVASIRMALALGLAALR